MIGIPIEMTPHFPTNAPIVLLTETAKSDPHIIDKMKTQLMAGKDVVITSGLLHALQGKGIEDICEVRATDRKLMINKYRGGDTKTDLSGSDPKSILIPQILLPTNDAWPLMPVVRGIANGHSAPLLLMDHYGKGTFYVLTIPDNPNDLYDLPEPTLNVLRDFLTRDLPVQIDAPSKVSLFLYNNNTFVIQSFRDTPTTATILVAGTGKRLRNILTAKILSGSAAKSRIERYTRKANERTSFQVTIPPHSYVAFSTK